MDMEKLQIQIEAESSDAANSIDRLSASLKRLEQATQGGAGLESFKKDLEGLNKASGVSGALNKVSESVKKVRSDYSSLETRIKAVSSQFAKLPVEAQKAAQTAAKANNSLAALSQNRQAKTLEQVSASLDSLSKAATATSSTFGNNRENITAVANAYAALPSSVQRAISAMAKVEELSNKNGKTLTLFATKIKASVAMLASYSFVLRKIASVSGGSVTSINEYIENVNLFQVAMGEFYDEAFAYANLVEDRLGIDSSEWMRNQGVFMSMANGFGLARKQAYDLSESLTELTYDISSLYNEDMTTAAQRLQSALAGEIEPIRRLGISISQATLEEFALSKGIQESVTQMTEQEKALLRSLKLIEGASTIGAVGDFVKTIESPANAMRILQQQLTQLSRAFGSVLLPAVISVLPYLQAFVGIVTDAIRALASFVGFTMPEWDANDWGQEAVGDMGGSFDDATASAKKFKSAMLGIDELNVISPPSGSAGGGAEVSGWAAGLEIPNLWDKEQIAAIEREADQIREKLEPILKVVGLIAAGLAGWAIARSFLDGLSSANGALLTVLGSALYLYNAFDAFNTGLDWSNLIGMIGGASLAVLALRSAFGKTAAAVGLLVSTIGFLIVGIKDVFENGFTPQNMLSLALGVVGIGVAVGLLSGSIQKGLVAGAIVLAITAFILLTDKVFGVLNAIKQMVWNGVLLIANLASAAAAAAGNFVILMKNTASGLWEVWQTATFNILAAFINTWEGAKAKFNGFLEAVLTGIKWIADKANGLLEVFGVQIDTSGISKQLDELEAQQAAGREIEYKSFADAWDKGFSKTEFINVKAAAQSYEYGGIEEAYATGSAIGEGIQNSIKELLGVEAQQPVMDTIGGFQEFMAEATGIENQWREEFGTGLNDKIDGLEDVQKSVSESSTQKVNSAVRSAASQITSAVNRMRINIVNNYITESSSPARYATGGFPQMGELFIAREAGPEMVGNIGGRSAVANNDQIVEGISAGVYAAVSAAMQGGEDNINLAVYLDGKQLNAAIKKVQKQAGARIGTSGLIYT